MILRQKRDKLRYFDSYRRRDTSTSNEFKSIIILAQVSSIYRSLSLIFLLLSYAALENQYFHAKE